MTVCTISTVILVNGSGSNTSAESLQKLEENPHSCAELYGKLAKKLRNVGV